MPERGYFYNKKFFFSAWQLYVNRRLPTSQFIEMIAHTKQNYRKHLNYLVHVEDDYIQRYTREFADVNEGNMQSPQKLVLVLFLLLFLHFISKFIGVPDPEFDARVLRNLGLQRPAGREVNDRPPEMEQRGDGMQQVWAELLNIMLVDLANPAGQVDVDVPPASPNDDQRQRDVGKEFFFLFFIYLVFNNLF